MPTARAPIWARRIWSTLCMINLKPPPTSPSTAVLRDAAIREGQLGVAVAAMPHHRLGARDPEAGRAAIDQKQRDAAARRLSLSVSAIRIT